MFDFIIEMIADIVAPAIKPILQGKLLLSRLLLRMNGKAALRPATDWYMKSQSLHGRLLTIIATVDVPQLAMMNWASICFSIF